MRNYQHSQTAFCLGTVHVTDAQLSISNATEVVLLISAATGFNGFVGPVHWRSPVTYAAWTEGATEADVEMIRNVMKQSPHMLSPCADDVPPGRVGYHIVEEMAERTGLEADASDGRRVSCWDSAGGTPLKPP